MGKAQPSSTLVDWHTARDAARISGLTLDMVNYLCRHKYVTPSHATSNGTKKRGYGVVRKYTYSDVLLLRVISKLLKQGISVKNLVKSLGALQRRGMRTSELSSKKYVLTDGNKIYIEDNATLELLDSGQLAFAFVLELGSLRKEVDAKIKTRRFA